VIEDYLHYSKDKDLVDIDLKNDLIILRKELGLAQARYHK